MIFLRGMNASKYKAMSAENSFDIGKEICVRN